MNKKQKITLLSGVAIIAASPFVGLLVGSLLRPLTCPARIPGHSQLSQCPTADFLIWMIVGIILLALGVSLVTGTLAARKLKKKNPAKPLFIIPWTKRLKTPVTKPGLKRFVKHGVLIVIIAAVGTASSFLPFTYAVVRCGRLPVESSTFMADYSYRLPGDRAYGIHIFSEYQYCTQRDIVATNGYHRNVYTDAAKVADEANRLKWEEETRFDPMKINYQAYVPELEGFEMSDLRISQMSDSDTQTFFNLKNSATLAGFNFREGKVPNAYELCTSPRYQCEEIGHDARGNVIKKQTANTTISYEVAINGTFVQVGQGAYANFSDGQMIALFNSLVPYSK